MSNYAAGVIATAILYLPMLALLLAGTAVNPDSSGHRRAHAGGAGVAYLLYCAAWTFSGAQGIPYGAVAGYAAGALFLGLCLRRRHLVRAVRPAPVKPARPGGRHWAENP